MQQVSAIILTGGKSSRMGQDKGLMLYKNKPLVQYAIDLMKGLRVNELLLSANREEYLKFNYPCIKDVYSNIGPIGGLHAALSSSSNEINLVAPCDVPLLDHSIYQSILNASELADVVVLKHFDGKIEPLIGLYKKKVLAQIEKQIKEKNYKLIDLLNHLKVSYVDVKSSWNISNINNREDIE